MQALSTTDKILNACDALFYVKGLQAVSVDQVAEAAGLTKRTLYYHFKSKDLLIEAWLRRRAEAARTETLAIPGSAMERLRTAFARMEPQVVHPAYRGCPFVNALAELADPTHPAAAVAKVYKADRLAWFAAIAEELGKPETHAEILMTLWEGALARAVITRSPDSVKAAVAAAELILA